MKHTITLTASSLLSVFLLSLHLTDDIVYGSEKSAILSAMSAAILVIWLFGTLVLAERRLGYVIMLLGSVAGLVVFTVHASNAGGITAGPVAQSSGAFFFTWTLLMLAVTSVLSAILAMLGLWDLRRSENSSIRGTVAGYRA